MLKVPDIEDIKDVVRFAQEAWYPVERDRDGNVKLVAKIRSADADTQMINVHEWDGKKLTPKAYSFNKFLSLEQGYYKSRFVEYNGTIVFLMNEGANEHKRNHSYRTDAVRPRYLHADIASNFEYLDVGEQAMIGLSIKRTRAYEAVAMLEDGKVIGCALSDNFGLITSDKAPEVQLVRRTKVIGKVIKGYPTLDKGNEHYFHAVSKLWR